jgi:hypothetical protein
MIRQLEQIPYIKDLVKRLRRERSLREACGYRDKTLTEAHFTQMKKRVGAEGFKIIEAWLRREALRHRSSQPPSSAGLIQAACVDGTDPSLEQQHFHHHHRVHVGASSLGTLIVVEVLDDGCEGLPVYEGFYLGEFVPLLLVSLVGFSAHIGSEGFHE